MLDTMSAKGTWHGNGVSAVDIQVSNVLIVENDLPHTETLARGLERHGHRVTCVAHGGRGTSCSRGCVHCPDGLGTTGS